VSGVYDVSVFSPDGKEVELKKPVTISHLVVLPVSHFLVITPATFLHLLPLMDSQSLTLPLPPVRVPCSSSLLFQKGEDPRDTCLGYNPNKREDSSWKCDNKGVKIKKVNSTKTQNIFSVSQEFDHFTGFSVLLGSSFLLPLTSLSLFFIFFFFFRRCLFWCRQLFVLHTSVVDDCLFNRSRTLHIPSVYNLLLLQKTSLENRGSHSSLFGSR
jgi:hypothetical protein